MNCDRALLGMGFIIKGFVGKFVKLFRAVIFQNNINTIFLKVEMRMRLAKLFAKTENGLSPYQFL